MNIVNVVSGGGVIVISKQSDIKKVNLVDSFEILSKLNSIKPPSDKATDLQISKYEIKCEKELARCNALLVKAEERLSKLIDKELDGAN